MSIKIVKVQRNCMKFKLKAQRYDIGSIFAYPFKQFLKYIAMKIIGMRIRI